MLIEIQDLLQNDLPFTKRWFHSSEAELFLWEIDSEILAFQFCFTSFHGEISFSWKKGNFININQVDKGNNMGMIGLNESELVTTNVDYSINKIHNRFVELAKKIPSNIYTFIDNIFLKL